MMARPELAAVTAAIEREPRLRCSLGMRFYLDAKLDARASIASIRARLDAIAPSTWTTLELRHRDRLKPEPFTADKAARLDGWLRGPWRHARLAVHLATARGVCDDTFGFDVAKPASGTRAHAVYRAWPVAWAAEHLEQLERGFLDIVEHHDVVAAHCGAMVVESHEWPIGTSLGDLVRRTTAACIAHPEWDRLELPAASEALSGVSWWTYLGAELSARCPAASAPRTLALRGGLALCASASPFGAEAAAGQAALHAALAPVIVPHALSSFIPDLEGIMRHEPKEGMLHVALELHEANHAAGIAACDTDSRDAWTALLDRYLDTARRLRALGLPDRDAAGRPSWAHPTACLGLLPTILHRAPGDVTPGQLAEHYATAWAELAGGHRNPHGIELRAELLARVKGLGPAARKQSWRDPDVHRRIELAGALPALYAAGGIALVQPYLDEAARLAEAHPVIHHALARIHAAEARPELVRAHVEAARRAAYEHAAHLPSDDFLGAASAAVAGPDPATFEPARVVFAGNDLVLVHHASRGRFTFHCARAGCAKGDDVQIGGFDGVKARYLQLPGRLHEEW